MLRKAALLLASMVTIGWVSVAMAADSAVQGNLLEAADTKASGEYAFSQCRQLQGEPFDARSNQKKAVIVGDSYACDFINSVQENGYLKDYQIRLRFIPYNCQTVSGEDAAKFIEAKDRAFCAKPERADSLERAKAQIQEADLVIFASRWKPAIAAALPQTLHQLGLTPQQKVVVVGSKFFGKISVRQYLRMPANELKTLQNEVDAEEAKAINAVLAKQLDKDVAFIDPHALLCGDDTSCPLFTDDLNLISYDGRHLTKEGARYVGKVLFQHSVLRQM
ncbi:MAG: SGNH hydrolase domain-containing protein [Candidatus Thiothrix putei]|uniref:SGNH hydrolase domain-containing protein n=1 Tax=Candidatus Thiothrix putei TaxID=3080811 RepID=A0AA95H9I0_9GAMM|nr:MAG: SGNH hydrolase domain-containing protein [Candidatus Thiothrix putei]